jgi:excinuclease ABC subunit C
MSAVTHPCPGLRPPAGSIPRSPGVYRFLDERGHILYVGKAKQLSSRVNSYFSDPARLHPRTLRMLSEASSLDWTVCTSEGEALVLEQRWIRAEQPRFNVALRDGDGYPGLVITTDGIARMGTWRGRPAAGTSFGPYPGVDPSTMIDVLGRVFKLRSCNERVYRQAEETGRACILADTGRCAAPCIGNDTAEDHRVRAENTIAFLSGKDRSVLERLRSEMETSAETQQYELAAMRRDELGALQRVLVPQSVVLGEVDLDAFAVHIDSGVAGLAVVRIRGGELRSLVRRYASPDPTLGDGEQRAQLLLALAAELGDIPALVVCADRSAPLREALEALRGAPLKLRAPRGAQEHRLGELAQRNAVEALSGGRQRKDLSVDDRDEALTALGEALGIARPRRIECIDISHTQGVAPTASLVVMIDGVMQPRQYRRFAIPVELGGDDYASIAYAVQRRLGGAGLDELPDLLVIDGGPGQVGCAAGELDRFGPTPTPVRLVGLAKRLEELWSPGDPDPVLLSRENPALRVAQLVRDEAHRYALLSHRRKREQQALRTRLDEIAGVGPSRRRALLERFGSLDAIAKASAEELGSVDGVGADLARRIWLTYHPS